MPAAKTSRNQDELAKSLNETLPFQRREWVVQRIGWVLCALFVLAGLLGLFGNGPLAHRVVTNPALQIEHDWLIRRDAPTTWKLTPRAPPAEHRYRVALDANWAQHFRILAIQPEPASARLSAGRWVYEFEASDSVPIVFHVEARRMGTLEGSIRLNDAPPLQVSQFAYP